MAATRASCPSALPSLRAQDFAERAQLKIAFIELAARFSALTADEAIAHAALQCEWRSLEKAAHPVSWEMAECWRANLNDLLRQARARQQKNHPHFFQPFEPSAAALLRAYYASRCPVYPVTTRLTTLLGYPITNGITRRVVGDYGAYLEFSAAHLVVQLAPRFPGTPRRCPG